MRFRLHGSVIRIIPQSVCLSRKEERSSTRRCVAPILRRDVGARRAHVGRSLASAKESAVNIRLKTLTAARTPIRAHAHFPRSTQADCCTGFLSGRDRNMALRLRSRFRSDTRQAGWELSGHHGPLSCAHARGRVRLSRSLLGLALAGRCARKAVRTALAVRGRARSVFSAGTLVPKTWSCVTSG